MSIAFVTLAQTPGSAQRSAQRAVVPALQHTVTARAVRHAPLPGATNTRHTAVSRVQTKRHGTGPMDSYPPFFLPPVNYDSGGGAVAVAVADVNGDGKLDLIVANGSGLVGALLGNGDGTFQPVSVYDSNGTQTTALAIADVNGDGKPDLIVSEQWDWLVSVLLNTGDGTFQPGVTYYAQGGAWVTAADLNRDGNIDLVVSNWCYGGYKCPKFDGAVTVMIGNGNGYFFPAGFYDAKGEQTAAVAIGDLNGDGKPDIVVANQCTSEGCTHEFHGWATVLIGHGDGSFDDPVNYAALNHTHRVVIADLNGDGKPDVVANSAGSGVGVLLGYGNGSFRPVTAYDSGGYTGGSLAVGDVDGDGKLDIVACNSWSGTVAVLPGNGDGSFQPPVVQDCSCFSLALADLNGDGRMDMVVANGGVGVMMHVGVTPSTTSVISSLNPSVFMQSVTFTATVSSSSGRPTGSVQFFDGSTSLGTATLANGIGSLAISSLSGGAHSITAVYQGSTQFSSSVSAVLAQTVNPEASNTSLVSSLNPALLKESVTYTATVVGQYGGAVTGTVAFQDGNSTVATVDMVGNQAAYTTSYSSPGTHSITAIYSGDANNNGSVSPPLLETINRGIPSKTTLTTSGSPVLVGQPVTFTAKVTSKRGAIPDGEPVTFYDGTTALDSVALAGGQAAYTTSSLAARKHNIKGTYSGDSIFQSSTGGVSQVVEKYSTTTTLSSNPNPSQSGQPVTFTAEVTSSGPTPTGTVLFLDGANKLGTARLNGNEAILTTTKLAVGTHAITAEYRADADNAKSTSPVLDQVVQ